MINRHLNKFLLSLVVIIIFAACDVTKKVPEGSYLHRFSYPCKMRQKAVAWIIV
jgi:hypothetical protein